MPAPRIVLVLIASLALLAGCGSDDESSSASAPDTAAQETAEQEGGGGSAKPDASGCREITDFQPRQDGKERKPAAKLDPKAQTEVDLETSCGTIGIRLDPEQSPNNAASLASLARKGFYDGTAFHRIAPNFVIQGGDPTASGMGGAGYSVVDKPPADARYSPGVVAMAKSGQEAAGTGGSQFFIVLGEQALPPDYAIVGEVVRGQKVVDTIGGFGDPSTEQPTRIVTIDKATVRGG